MNQYTKGLTEEYKKAKFRRGVLRVRAHDVKEQYQYLEKRVKELKAEYHRLVKEASKPLWEIIKDGKNHI